MGPTTLGARHSLAGIRAWGSASRWRWRDTSAVASAPRCRQPHARALGSHVRASCVAVGPSSSARRRGPSSVSSSRQRSNRQTRTRPPAEPRSDALRSSTAPAAFPRDPSRRDAAPERSERRGGRLHPQVARRPAARRAGIPEHATSSGCRTSVSRPSTGSSTPTNASSASGCSCRPKQELAACSARREPLAHARVADAGPRVRRLRLLRLLRVGLHQRRHMLRMAGLKPRADRRHRLRSAGGDRRRRDVREPGTARAVRGRDRGRRSRAARAVDRRGVRRRRTSRDRRACSTRLASETRLLRAEPVRRRPTTAPAGSPRSRRGPAPARPPVVRKAAVKAADRLDPPSTSIFTPDTEFGSRLLIEVVRGCANLCRFCWAGYNYLPVRPFSTEPDPRDRRSRAALREARGPRVDRALRPSRHRADPRAARRDGLRHQPGVAPPRRSHRDRSSRLLRESGERSITIAPETGSDRLRRVINKTVTNDEILDRADLIFRSGIENLKLYYMIGLPTETDEDLVAIRDLTIAIRERMVEPRPRARHDRARRRVREPARSRSPGPPISGCR